MFYQKLAETFGSLSEFAVHPHVPAERAFLFHAIDGGSTEIETLNFLHALVYSWKPKLVIETGVFRGFGTIAIGSALKATGFGKVYSVEIDPERIAEAKEHIAQFDSGIMDHVQFVLSDSLEFINSFYAGRFDLAFLDSETWLRHKEFLALRERMLLSPGAVVMFHDTSRLRSESAEGSDNYELNATLDGCSDLDADLECPFSRGFRVLTL